MEQQPGEPAAAADEPAEGAPHQDGEPEHRGDPQSAAGLSTSSTTGHNTIKLSAFTPVVGVVIPSSRGSSYFQSVSHSSYSRCWGCGQAAMNFLFPVVKWIKTSSSKDPFSRALGWRPRSAS